MKQFNIWYIHFNVHQRIQINSRIKQIFHALLFSYFPYTGNWVSLRVESDSTYKYVGWDIYDCCEFKHFSCGKNIPKAKAENINSRKLHIRD